MDDRTFYTVDGIQACAPEALPLVWYDVEQNADLDYFVEIRLSYDVDMMGFHTVELRSPSRDAIVACVNAHWGEENPEWTQEWVVDRIREEA